MDAVVDRRSIQDPAVRAVPLARGDLLQVGDLQIDPGTREVTRDGERIPLPRLSFRFLMALVDAAPATVSTDELVERAWGGRIVSNETVTQRVRLVRQALGDDAHDPRYVAVVRGEGYRLLPPVLRVPPSAPDAASLNAERPRRLPRAAVWLVLAVLASGALTLSGRFGSIADPVPPHVRVQPFAGHATDPDQAFFAEGLTADVIARLARIPALRVSTTWDTDGSGAADHVLSGFVDWDGERARITARLVSGQDGTTLWSDAFTYAEGDRFAAQSEIAEAVARALRVRVLGTTHDDIGTDDVRAYAHYLRGLTLFGHHTDEKNEQAILAFRSALEIDPNFARAWIQLGQSYGARAREPAGREAAIEAMAEATARARALAPGHWDPLTLEAWLQLTRNEFVAADRSMRGATALGIDLSDVRDVYCPIACFHDQFGRVSAALAEARRARLVDPLGVSAELHVRLLRLGRIEEALAEFEAFEQLQPRPLRSDQFRVFVAMQGGNAAVVNAWLTGTPLEGLWGRSEAMLTVLRGYRQAPPLRRGKRAFFARAAAAHGDVPLAMDFLRQEYLVPGYGALFWLWDPLLAPVRATPEFAGLVAEMGLVDAWRDSGDWGDFCAPDGQGGVRCW